MLTAFKLQIFLNCKYSYIKIRYETAHKTLQSKELTIYP